MFYLIIQPPHRSLTLGQQLPEMFILLPHSVDLLHQSIHTASDRLWIGRKRVESQNPFVRNFASKQYIFEGSIRLKKVILNFQQKNRTHLSARTLTDRHLLAEFARWHLRAGPRLLRLRWTVRTVSALDVMQMDWLTIPEKNRVKTATENAAPKTQTFQNN